MGELWSVLWEFIVWSISCICHCLLSGRCVNFFDTLTLDQYAQHFCKQYCQMHFLKRTIWYFDANFNEIYSEGFNWQYVIIGSGNGLALNRWQAIIWTNGHLIRRRIYAALGVELNALMLAHKGKPFAHSTFKCIFSKEQFGILMQISVKFVLVGSIANMWPLV